MITKDKAIELVQSFLHDLGLKSGREYAFANDRILERDKVYVFFFNSRRFIETRDLRYRLIGNGPILVSKIDGFLKMYGSGKPVDVAVADFEQLITAG